ncbi:D-alanyl-D-alanine carboxypeptidase family protein [Aureibacillus halotolerans]|uniref:D-alanyl-D-alanine carboxypeptidase-like protein n=1 Tax=Aureibacillus halotolerans TaxID=1508390 RepID=A0A4R6TUK6_9BACI|nr:D-alanyl-D-alanine carboxypeptidase [Aureibacillus halotolerans]TDQ37418.1 D-alanyl-D-alanine carboxypeptidase-like protein [Aureibacillus halotolerans]
MKRSTFPHQTNDTTIVAKSALVIDEKSGQVLYEKKSQMRVFPASATKVLTGLAATSLCKLNEKITVGEEVLAETKGESLAGLTPGDTYLFAELLAALMIPSGNDAARALAMHVARRDLRKDISYDAGIRYFTWAMNEAASRAGAVSSQFVNPHGLHDTRHFTTAQDMMQITKEARKNLVLCNVVRRPVWTSPRLHFVNRNELIHPESPFFYQGAEGFKTGYTKKAGRCLISAASRNNEQILAAAFGSKDHHIWSDAHTLLNMGFKRTSAKAV